MSHKNRLTALIGIEPSSLSPQRRTALRRFLGCIILGHFLAFILSWYFARLLISTDERSRELYVLFLHILSLFAFIIGMFILMLSAINESLAKESLALTRQTSHTEAIKYNKFITHLNWLKDNLNPSQFNSRNINLTIAISTPLYGIAVGSEEANKFFGFMEEWIEHFESLPENNSYRPVITFTVWDADCHSAEFRDPINRIKDAPEQRKLMTLFAALLKRLYDLCATNRAYVHLHYSDRSDTRIFLVSDEKSGSYGGMLVVFSPLTHSVDENDKWHLVGFSVSDRQGYDSVEYLHQRLQRKKFNKMATDHIEELKDSKAWLCKQYKLSADELFADTALPQIKLLK